MRFNTLIPHKRFLLGQSNSPQTLHSKIRYLVQRGEYREALRLFSREEQSPLPTASHLVFPPLLKACTALSKTLHGKTIHAKAIEMGLQFDPYIATSLINMYVRSGSLGSAVNVFEKTSECEDSAQHVTLWNAVIDGYFKFLELDMGLACLSQMQSLGMRPDIFTLTMLLGARGSSSVSYALGKEIHGFSVRSFSHNDPFLETALINMYSSSGDVTYAWHVFQTLEDNSNIVVWNVMIAGFWSNNMWEKSLELLLLAKRSNCKLSSGTFSNSLSACSQGGDVICGEQIHSDALKTGFEHDPYVCTSLLSMYARCGFIQDADKIFDSVPDKQIETWNAMISGYVKNYYDYDALSVFVKLKSTGILPDPITISNILPVCSEIGLYDFGRTVHSELIKRPLQNNVAVQSALITFYSKHGITENAKAVFFNIEEKDIVAWGSMISGFCQNGSFDESVELFKVLLAGAVNPDSDVMSSVICACAGLNDAHLGIAVHGFSVKSGFESDEFVANSLIEMYSKVGVLEDAERVFSLMPYRNLVAWNSMISCYCRNNKPEMSISIFSQIGQHGLFHDSFSFTNVLVAVSSLSGLTKGKEIHAHLIRSSFSCHLQVQTSLIDMYSKSGSLLYARSIFNNMSTRSLVTWNTIISAYGSHGQCLEAFKLFDEMKSSGTNPDEITFLSLITSCSHSGFVDQGLDLIHSMKREFNINPRIEHYMSVVDLLGRGGRLEEAYGFIQKMEVEPDERIWSCLLAACCVSTNLELGELAANNLLRKEGFRSIDLVQLMRLYGKSGLWDMAGSLRAALKELGLKKLPGCSWIELRNENKAFFSGDSNSPFSKEIFQMLKRLKADMKGNEEDYYDSNIQL